MRGASADARRELPENWLQMMASFGQMESIRETNGRAAMALIDTNKTTLYFPLSYRFHSRRKPRKPGKLSR